MTDQANVDLAGMLHQIADFASALAHGLSGVSKNLTESLNEASRFVDQKSNASVVLRPSVFLMDARSQMVVYCLAAKGRNNAQTEQDPFIELEKSWLCLRYPKEGMLSKGSRSNCDLLSRALDINNIGRPLLAQCPDDKLYLTSDCSFFTRTFNKLHVLKDNSWVEENINNKTTLYYPSSVRLQVIAKEISAVVILAQGLNLPGQSPVYCVVICTAKIDKMQHTSLPFDFYHTHFKEKGVFTEFLVACAYQFVNYTFHAAKGDHLQKLGVIQLMELYKDEEPLGAAKMLYKGNYCELARRLVLGNLSLTENVWAIPDIPQNNEEEETRLYLASTGKIGSISIDAAKKLALAGMTIMRNRQRMEIFLKKAGFQDYPLAWFGDLIDLLKPPAAAELLADIGTTILNDSGFGGDKRLMALRDLWQAGVGLCHKKKNLPQHIFTENVWPILRDTLIQQTDGNLLYEMLEYAKLCKRILSEPFIEQILGDALVEMLLKTPKYHFQIVHDQLKAIETITLKGSGGHDENKEEERKMQPILVTSQKGGVGKSTIAACVARQLASNHRVLLIELDICGPTYGFWDDICVDGYVTTQTLMRGIRAKVKDFSEVRDGKKLNNIQFAHSKPLTIIPAELRRYSQNFHAYNVSIYLRDILDLLKTSLETEEKFDYVVLDSPAEHIEQVFLSANEAGKRQGAVIHVADPSPHTIIPCMESAVSHFAYNRQFLLVNKVGEMDIPFFINRDRLCQFLLGQGAPLASFGTRMSSLVYKMCMFDGVFMMPRRASLGKFKSIADVTRSDDWKLGDLMCCYMECNPDIEALTKAILNTPQSEINYGCLDPRT